MAGVVGNRSGNATVRCGGAASGADVMPWREAAAGRRWAVVVLAAVVALALALCLPATAHAAQSTAFSKTIDGAKYRIDAWYGDYEIAGYNDWHLEATYFGPTNKKKISYTIPKSVKVTFKGEKRTVLVTGIGKKAFAKCSKMTKVNCKAPVTFIGDYAFANCKKLKTFSSKAPVEFVGKKAFYGCKNLRTFKSKQDWVRSVGASAFQGCAKPKSFPRMTALYSWAEKLEDNYALIEKKAFYGCKGLKSFSVNASGYGVWVEKGAFQGCSGLEKFSLTGDT